MASTIVFENLSKAFDAFDLAERVLAVSRKLNEPQECVARLQNRLAAAGEKVDACWDAMNDAWLAESLSKVIG